MKSLLDMGISPESAAFLRESGHEATHLHQEQLHRLPDPEILGKARAERAVLVAHDLDFADLLAASGAKLPSVVLFRLRDMRPEKSTAISDWCSTITRLRSRRERSSPSRRPYPAASAADQEGL